MLVFVSVLRTVCIANDGQTHMFFETDIKT